MKKKSIVYCVILFGVALTQAKQTLGLAEDKSARDEFYPREEVVYSYRASLDRQEEHEREIKLHQYQQKQYLEKQRLIYQHNLYNQARQEHAPE